jgi:hypothetical protein
MLIVHQIQNIIFYLVMAMLLILVVFIYKIRNKRFDLFCFFQGQMASFFIILGTRLQCNIFSYDYSGYGASQGKASEKNMYADIEATYNSIKQRYHIPESKIILYGQSIGKIKIINIKFFIFAIH